jgi:hypothetical protein
MTLTVIFLILSCITSSVLGQLTLKYTMTVTNSGNGTAYCLAFDGGSFYLGYGLGFSPLVRYEPATGNILYGTEKADIRAISFFLSLGDVLAWGRLESTPDVNQIYVVDRDTLSFSSIYGHSNISTQPLKPVFLYAPPSTQETWRHFETYDGFASNTATVTEYSNQGLVLQSYKLAYGAPPIPGISATTRMHYYHSYNWHVYYVASDRSIYVKYPSPMNRTADPYVLPDYTGPTVNENFVGITRDGLLWMYESESSKWKGYFYDDCGEQPKIVVPSPTAPDVNCDDSTNPYENEPLRFPSMTCGSVPYYFWPYSFYVDSTSKNCSALGKFKNIHRQWYVNSWSNTTTSVYSQTFAVQMFDPSFNTPVAEQTQTHTLTCKDSILPEIDPPGIGDLVQTTDFPCNDGPMQYYDNITNQLCPHIYDINRTWYYENYCLGTQKFPQTLQIRDTTSPTIAINSSITYWNETEPNYTGIPTYSDNCSPVSQIVIHPPSDTITNSGDFCKENAIIDRTWTVTDECGLSSSVSQEITVMPPQLEIPADITQECPYNTHPNNTGYASSWAPYTFSYEDEIVDPPVCSAQTDYKIRIIARTWQVTDSICGTRNGTQYIFLTDRTPPVFDVPADITLNCETIPDMIPLPDSPLLHKATATDSCDISRVNITVVDKKSELIGPPPLLPFCKNGVLNNRTTVRSWSVVDTCGNTVSKQQKVTFVDKTPPQWVFPPNTTIQSITCTKSAKCKSSAVADQVGYPNTNITSENIDDNCDPSPKVEFVGEKFSDTCDAYSYTWKMTDWCANVYEFTYTVNITIDAPNSAINHKSLSAWIFMVLLVLYFVNEIE